MQAVTPRATDALVAEVFTELLKATEAGDACALVLSRAFAETGFERGVAAIRSTSGFIGGGVGIPDRSVRAFLDRASDPDASIYLDVQKPGGRALRFSIAEALGFQAAVVLTFDGGGGKPLGAVIVEAEDDDDRIRLVADLFSRVAPGLSRCLELQQLHARSDKVSRQRDLLSSIIDGLPDPVLLTSPENEMLLANSRAERLFSASAEDSEGRKRAIQINALLFSSSLTRAIISTPSAGAGRELNLVDPNDGSDLVFEVLSFPASPHLAPEGSVLSILRDITDLKRAVTQLEQQFNRSRLAEHHARHERDQLDAILENVSDPILVTDQQSNIVLLNPEADRLFVVETTDAGEARRAVQANDMKFTSVISDFLLSGESRRVTRVDITDPDGGSVFPAEIVSRKIVDARGEPTAIVSLVHDLTQAVENERLASELQALNDQLEDRIRRATVELEEHNRRLEWQSFEIEKAYQLKSQFLASMSHELRTPINVILGYTSLMRERIYGDLTAQQEESLAKVHTTSQHLLELINDILDLSKIEAGKMPVHLETFDVRKLIEELFEAVDPMLRKRTLKYEADLAEDLPPLHTDRTKLKQILLNLLSNAIKFTANGFVRVRVENAAKDRIRIIVADSGIGIRQEHLDVIFEDFRQVDQSRTREYGGTGLGLSITKKLLTLLGGVISVDSKYGEGSRFTIDLPVSTAPISIEEQVRLATVDADKAVLRG